MKKQIIFAIIITLLVSIVPFGTLAESAFFSIVEATMNEITDCSDKQFIQLSAGEI